MHKKTRSLLQELQSFGDEKDINHIIESRATNIIASAINLVGLFQKHYPGDKADLLEKKLLSAIKNKDQTKFSKSLRKKK